MFRRNNRSFLTGRNKRRADKANFRSHRNDQRWMARYERRQARLARWKAAFGRFIPLTLSKFKYFWAAMTALMSRFIPTQNITRKPRKNNSTRRRQLAIAGSSGYENLEPRQMLAADFLVSLDPMTATLSIVGDSGDNQIAVDASSGTGSVEFFAGSGGSFVLDDSTEGLGLEPSLESSILTVIGGFESITVDGAGGADTLTAIGTESVDLTFIGGVGDDTFDLQDGGVLAALNPAGGNANLLSGDTLSASGSGNRVDGAFVGASSSTIFVDGTVELEPLGGDLTLGGGDNFATTGTIYIGDNYELTLDDPNAASLGSLTTVTEGGTLTAEQGINLSIGDVLTGAGTVDVGGAGAVDVTVTNDLNINSGTVDGSLTIDGDVDLDEGILTGTTTVNGNVDLGTGLVAGNVTVNGALSGPSVDDNAATISPGFSPGIVTVTGGLVLVGGDTLEIEVDGAAGAGVVGGHDQVDVTGTVDLGGATLNLSSAGSLSIPAGTELVIVQNDGTDGITGIFGGIAEGDVLIVGDQLFAISYFGGTGNDVTLTARDPAQVEFELAESSDGETITGTTVPTLLVLGDLTGVPEEARTIDFSLTAGTATEGVSDDFLLENSFIIPALDFSGPGATEFDLTQYSSAGVVDPTNAVLRVFQDTIVEGQEGLSFNFTNGLGLGLVAADLNSDSSIRTGTTHNIVDDDFVRISIVPVPSSVEEGTVVSGNLVIETSSTGSSGPFDNSATIAPGTSISFRIQDANTGTALVGASNDFTFLDGVVTLTDVDAFPQTLGFTLTTIDDALVESDETVDLEIVEITSTTVSGATDLAVPQVIAQNGTVTITDNDLVTFSIDSDVNTVVEGADVTFTISLVGSGSTSGAGPFALQTGEIASINLAENNGPAPATTSADFDSFLAELATVAGGRADLDLTGTTLTVTGNGSPTADIDVVITTNDDALIEGPENFNVVLSGPASTSGADVQLDAAAASEQIEITDNDLVTFSIDSDVNTVAEGANVTFTISLVGSGSTSGTDPFALQTGETASIDLAENNGPAPATTSADFDSFLACLLYTSPSPRDRTRSRMPSSA